MIKKNTTYHVKKTSNCEEAEATRYEGEHNRHMGVSVHNKIHHS